MNEHFNDLDKQDKGVDYYADLIRSPLRSTNVFNKLMFHERIRTIDLNRIERLREFNLVENQKMKNDMIKKLRVYNLKIRDNNEKCDHFKHRRDMVQNSIKSHLDQLPHNVRNKMNSSSDYTYKTQDFITSIDNLFSTNNKELNSNENNTTTAQHLVKFDDSIQIIHTEVPNGDHYGIKKDKTTTRTKNIKSNGNINNSSVLLSAFKLPLELGDEIMEFKKKPNRRNYQ